MYSLHWKSLLNPDRNFLAKTPRISKNVFTEGNLSLHFSTIHAIHIIPVHTLVVEQNYHSTHFYLLKYNFIRLTNGVILIPVCFRLLCLVYESDKSRDITKRDSHTHTQIRSQSHKWGSITQQDSHTLICIVGDVSTHTFTYRPTVTGCL